jgi:hypothetical protein
MNPTLIAISLLGGLLAAAPVHADSFDTWYGFSPNKKLYAMERRVPDARDPSRLDIDGFVIYVSSTESEQGSVVVPTSIIARREFPGRLVSQIRWSPDSTFLLFTTASSGGHSPWHFKTFVFCVADKSFRDVEDATWGSIGAADFRFESPNVVVLKLYDVTNGSLKEIRLTLEDAVRRMKRVD